MPGIITLPDKPEEIDRIIESEMAERRRYIANAWKYYRGEHKKPLKVRVDQPDDNVILNLCKRLANSSVAMLVGRGVKFDLQEGATTPAEATLEQFWQANKKQLFLNNLALFGSVTGQPVVQMVLREGQPPRLINVNPELLTVLWQANDMEKIMAYILRWQVGRVIYRQDFIAPDTPNGGWLVRELQKESGRQWKIVNETTWPYPWAPLLTWQNLPNPGKFYGLSDLESAELNDAINFVASNINRILRFHAHPRTIGTGMRADDVEATAVDSFWAIPKKDANIFNLEMQSDLQSSMRFLDFLRGAFFSESAGVDMTVFKDKIGSVTNFGLRVLFQDAIDRIELKHQTYGEALVELNRRALEVMGAGKENYTVIHWPEALPSDKVELTKLIAMEMEGGLTSKETAAKKLGLDWETEQERLQAEAANTGSLGEALVRAFSAGKGAK